MTADLAVEARGLTKRFGKVVALDHVSFEVPRGELFGFIGPDGAVTRAWYGVKADGHASEVVQALKA